MNIIKFQEVDKEFAKTYLLRLFSINGSVIKYAQSTYDGNTW